ncbi:hybrid sensor histidine kinase/response regulator [Halorubrum sodomense]|uniref:histidine kinase n=1 Tax=Halorubrum sodomense TaxID=35743 RepID=A0A1I6H218_HALSD|nr:PAS domain S-box protein [Halorubrum sodomense]SFR48401.1 PAS domain S-box-containing protein [Halorubrum sodomense]
MSDRIPVLLVDDDPDLRAVTASFLEREEDRLAVETAADAAAGLDVLADREVECIVSDYEMPGKDGLAFLESVRERDPDLPFVLFTGRGSEEVASEAISAGVTDYLQKRGGTERYERLANRIVEAVEKRRAERDAEQAVEQFRAVAEGASDAIVTIDTDGVIRFANPAVESVLGYEPSELEGKPLTTLMPERHRDDHREAMERYLDTGERGVDWSNVRFNALRRDGDEVPVSLSYGEFAVDGERQFVGVIRDETERDRHRAFIEHASDVVAVLSRDWRFRYLSPSCERVTGHAPSELLGERSLDYVHPDDREAVESAFASVDPGGTPPSAEYRFRTADGGYRWLESVGSDRIEADGVEGYVVTTRDVSERKERERTLSRLREWTRELNYTRTTEEAAELAVEAVDDLIDAGLSGIHLRTADGDSLEPAALGQSVPALFETQPSYDRDAPEGSRAALAWEAFHGEESVVVDELSTYEPLDESSPAESLVLRPIGDHGLFVVSSPEPREFTDTDVLVAEILSGHLEAALDRIERERRVERLHGATRTLVGADSREEIARRAVEAATDVLGFSIVTVRIHDEAAGGLVPMAVSPHAEELLPERETFTPDGGSLNWAVFESGEPEMYDDIRETDALDADTALRSLLIVPVGDHGTIAIGESEPEVFDGVDEYLAGILATAAETAFQAEARTRRLAERTAELERQNDRLEEFAGVVSHDLRNPLEVARGRTQLAREECDSDHLESVERAHDRMTALIDDLLTLAREGDPVTDAEPVDLGAVVDSCWRTVDTKAATLRAEANATVVADEGRLKQLLENLIRNSVEHGSTGSRTESGDSVEHGSTSSEGRSPSGNRAPPGDSRAEPDDSVEHGGESVTVAVGTLPDGFYVEDDGPGIDPDRREAVFDAGHSTSQSGTGFGLRIVEQVADAHGWSVRAVESEAGGARFEITGVDFAE